MYAILFEEANQRRNKMRVERRRLRDNTNPFEMPEERFREVFRLSRDAALILVDEIRPYLPQGQRKTFIPIPLRVCSAIHFFATGSYQRDIGHDFSAAMSRSMISRSIADVSSVLQNHLMNKWIKFPSVEEYEVIKRRYRFLLK